MSTGRTTLSQTERHQLIEENLELPKILARRKGRAGEAVFKHLDDVIADGFTGLVEAANAFDPSRGTFRSFASQRVRGAIQDGGRRMGQYSRQHYASLAQALPEDKQKTAQRTLQDGGHRMGPHSRWHNTPLALAFPDENHIRVDAGKLSSVSDETLPDPDEAIDRQRTLERTLRTVATLPELERQVVASYYFSGRTIQETAANIGLAEFTTCRLHTRALRRLRALLTGPAGTTTEQP